jgi:hypothetical protein
MKMTWFTALMPPEVVPVGVGDGEGEGPEDEESAPPAQPIVRQETRIRQSDARCFIFES